MGNQRYTLSLPSEIYDELKKYAEEHGISIRESVRRALQFGLIGIKVSENPDADLYIKEKVAASENETEIRETRLQFVW
ncbi:MAG: hypothetical protein AAF702_33610 [Chloroflexota bacterium]